MNHDITLAATFSIAARDAATGRLGVAVASRVLAVGASCPFVRAGVGAISSQAYLNPGLGVRGLELLADGLTAAQTLDKLLAGDEGRDWRQINIADSHGGSASHTGARADPWKGTRHGPNYALGGNLLVGEETVAAMERAFQDPAELEFGERLLRVLEAADAAGGDMRGKQSAALYVVYRQPVPYINLRVDDHAEPIRELRRLFTIGSETGYLAFTKKLSDTLQPRAPSENVERQRTLRQSLGIPLD
jgi:uncharacterized Ntn-hydrolase superfamily protein